MRFTRCRFSAPLLERNLDVPLGFTRQPLQVLDHSREIRFDGVAVRPRFVEMRQDPASHTEPSTTQEQQGQGSSLQQKRRSDQGSERKSDERVVIGADLGRLQERRIVRTTGTKMAWVLG